MPAESARADAGSTAASARAEQAARRHGWRVVFVYYLALWLVMALLGAITVVNQTHLRRLGAGEVLEFASLVLLSLLVAMGVGLAGTWRLLRPLRILERAVDAEACDAGTWRAASRIPLVVTGWNSCVVLGWAAFPLLSLSTVRPHYVNPVMVGLTVGFTFLGALMFGVPIVIGAQSLVRPLVGDAAARLGATRLPPLAPSIRLRLVTAVPIVAIVATLWAVPLGWVAGGAGVMTREELVAVAVALALVVPITRLVARSVVGPLDALVAAAERMKRGDFGAPIPESSMDEYGEIARAFNDAMAGLAERQRLAGENERLLDDVRASRARIVVASDEERRRIERNIHDGAQQQLVALALDLRLLEDEARASGCGELAASINSTARRLLDATDELRELARGVHPAVLETDGLDPALQQLAARSAVPVELAVAPGRVAAPLEAAAYFVVAEALANTAKHAGASRAWVTVAHEPDVLGVRVADDGAGGARVGAGSGLAGLADRVAALGGTFGLESRPGEGTTVTVRLPMDGAGALSTDVASVGEGSG